MTVYFTGDIHGGIDIRKLSTSGLARVGVASTQDDYLVVCGDFGLVWAWRGQNSEERYWLRWLGEKPFGKVLFVDGNHKNFDRLDRTFEPDQLTEYLELVRDTVEFDHYHMDRDFADSSSALCERIVRLEKTEPNADAPPCR